MGSGLSSPKPKYDSNQQKQKQVKKNVTAHKENSRDASHQEQQQTKINLRKHIQRQLHYITGEYLNTPNFNEFTMPLILDGMDNLLYLKTRKWNEPSENFLIKMGHRLQEFIPKYTDKYPKKERNILNLKTKFKAIYGTPFNKFKGKIAGYHKPS